MEEAMTKARLLETIHTERAAFESLLGQLDEAQMLQPGVEGDWSVKDILAHLTAWDTSMRQWLTEAVRGEVPNQPKSDEEIDQLNAAFYVANQDKPLAAVLADFHASYQQSLAVVQAISEADLLPPDRFAWREGNPLWYMVGGNTFWHYQGHGDSIRLWLEQA